MALQFTFHQRGNYVVAELTGKLTLGPHLNKFAREAESALSAPRVAGLVLDLAGVTEIDSAGLGELVVLYTASGEAGRYLCLLRTGAHVARLLEITSLADLFPKFHEEQSAAVWLRSKAGN